MMPRPVTQVGQQQKAAVTVFGQDFRCVEPGFSQSVGNVDKRAGGFALRWCIHEYLRPLRADDPEIAPEAGVARNSLRFADFEPGPGRGPVQKLPGARVGRRIGVYWMARHGWLLQW